GHRSGSHTCGLNHTRYSRPLRLPATQTALVLLHHRREKAGDECGDAGCRGKSESASNRVLLVRHGGGAATALAAAFGSLTYFALCEQADIARDLSQRPN